MNINPTDEQVHAMALHIYETEQRNEHMPPMNELPHMYMCGLLTEAAERLGWKHTEEVV